MRVRVEVTAEDIRKGRRKHPCACPVALAVERALCERTGARLVPVNVGNLSGGGWSLAVGNGEWQPLPDVAAAFAITFDRYGAGAVSPFAFDLDVWVSA